MGNARELRILPQALPRSGQVGLDAHVLLFTLALSLFAGILFGLAPALKAFQSNLQETLREGGRGSSGVRHSLQASSLSRKPRWHLYCSWEQA